MARFPIAVVIVVRVRRKRACAAFHCSSLTIRRSSRATRTHSDSGRFLGATSPESSRFFVLKVILVGGLRTAEVAARESGTVENNATARKRNTFEYLGKHVPMMRHLKIGVKGSVAETLRFHLHWDAESRRIVIGHCGSQLDFD